MCQDWTEQETLKTLLVRLNLSVHVLKRHLLSLHPEEKKKKCAFQSKQFRCSYEVDQRRGV